MIYRAPLLLLSVLMCSSTFAAHIVTQTRVGSNLVSQTDTHANALGDLFIKERDFGIGASTAADAAAATTVDPQVEYTLPKDGEITLFQSDRQAIVMVEGKICRILTADSKLPPGLGVPGMNAGDASKQLADIMKTATAALKEAKLRGRRDGMTAEQERALDDLTKPFMESQSVKPRDTLQIELLSGTTTVGRYRGAKVYRVTDLDDNEKYEVSVVPASDVAGGTDVRNAMIGMMKMYEEYLNKMGGGDLMDTVLPTLFSRDEFDGMFAVRVVDKNSGEITEVVEAHANGAAVKYYPKDCVEKDMFSF